MIYEIRAVNAEKIVTGTATTEKDCRLIDYGTDCGKNDSCGIDYTRTEE